MDTWWLTVSAQLQLKSLNYNVVSIVASQAKRFKDHNHLMHMKVFQSCTMQCSLDWPCIQISDKEAYVHYMAHHLDCLQDPRWLLLH